MRKERKQTKKNMKKVTRNKGKKKATSLKQKDKQTKQRESAKIKVINDNM